MYLSQDNPAKTNCNPSHEPDHLSYTLTDYPPVSVRHNQSHITCLKCLTHHLVTPNRYPCTFQIHSNVSLSQDRQTAKTTSQDNQPRQPAKTTSQNQIVKIVNSIPTYFSFIQMFISAKTDRQPKQNCNPHTKTTKPNSKNSIPIYFSHSFKCLSQPYTSTLISITCLNPSHEPDPHP